MTECQRCNDLEREIEEELMPRLERAEAIASSKALVCYRCGQGVRTDDVYVTRDDAYAHGICPDESVCYCRGEDEACYDCNGTGLYRQEATYGN